MALFRRPLPAPRSRPPAGRWTNGIREVVIIAGLWLAYGASRLLADYSFAAASHRASAILDVERYAGIDIERWLNEVTASVEWLGLATSYWYAALHYLVTPAALIFVYFRRRADYHRARDALILGSAIGLLGYIVLPTAPPRLVGGYVDVLAQNAEAGWWSSHASAPAGLGHLTNELAAMPSLHVGWTLWVAWALWGAFNRAARAVLVFYVLGTTFVVVATGNHWVLDAVAGLAVVALGIAVTGRGQLVLAPTPTTARASAPTSTQASTQAST